MHEDRGESVYDLVGGMAWFHDLCTRFYRRVADDAVLRPLYPDDLEPSRYWLVLFLAQYFGGPDEYSRDRGHPRLRMRHAHFRVGIVERDRWYGHMTAVLEEIEIDEGLHQQMLEYFSMAANHLVNTAD